MRQNADVMPTGPSPRPTSIRLYLSDGRPDGFRLVEKSNWTGLGVICARADYVRVRRREEWSRPGVYFLTGPGERPSREDLYVGEADDVRDRVDNHLKNKDFWTNVIAFTSKDDNLNKAHVRYLEAQLIAMATRADRVTLVNGTAPPLPRLSEADRADMEGFLADMLIILPLLGVVAFEALERKAAPADRLVLSSKDAEASGAETSEGFLVFEGSYARAGQVPSIDRSTSSLRRNLIEEGVLVRAGNRLRVTKPYLFASPSAAAAVLLGRTANGRIEWKDEQGQTLRQRQELALDKS